MVSTPSPMAKIRSSSSFSVRGGDVYRDAGEIDALVFAEHAAVDDLADDIAATLFDISNLLDAEFDKPVGEENLRAGLQIFSEGGEGGPHHLLGTFDLARGDGEAFSRNEQDGLVVDELAGADLRSLEVGKNADRLALFAADLADHLDQLGLLRMRAVGEVEAGDVKAGADESTEDFF